MKQAPLLKTALFVFVAAAVGAMIYKAAVGPCCEAGTGAAAAGTVPAGAPAVPAVSQPAPPASASKARPVPAPDAIAPVAAAGSRPAESKKALVYYFYTSARCRSCNLIEKYTREAVEENFQTPYKGWTVEFVGVNLDSPGQKHFVADYQLTNKAVVVQKLKGDRPGDWKSLPDVWRLLGTKELFSGYVAGEVRDMLDAG